MKRLIVNGDDFGMTNGVNRGILDAHRRGILTSASMMVDSPASAEAAELATGNPSLSVGLHVVLGSPPESGDAEAEVERQLERFVVLTGQPPTHLDTHHHVHRDERLLPAFLQVADRNGLPLRDHCGVHHIGSFYGQWNGETHLEAVSPSALARIVGSEVQEGFNELGCHPGYVDGGLESSYSREREAEVEALCDPGVAALLGEQSIRLTTFRELSGQ
jgi:predicted glycoside hydrolase/deacetylase ChbG (UPF0249 family)